MPQAVLVLLKHRQKENMRCVCEAAAGTGDPRCAPRRYCWWWGRVGSTSSTAGGGWSTRSVHHLGLKAKGDAYFCHGGSWP